MNTATRELERHQALVQLKLLDTPASESFDRITRMASRVFGLPIAAVSLTDKDRQWFKSRVGVDQPQLSRDKAPCAEVAESGASLVIPDLLESDVYRDSPLAQQGIRFYAAAPLLTRDGYGLGAMCVLGTEPRTTTVDEMNTLTDLAAMVMAQIELQHAFGRVEPTSGLPNRHQWLDDMEDQERDFPAELRSVVIVEAADGSRLREAVRVLGPGAVDEMIKSLAMRLRAQIPSSRTVYQVGATQFAWLIPHRNHAARLRVLAKIRAEVEIMVTRGDLPALAAPVVGVTSFRLGEMSPEDALRSAHNAAQDARNSDRFISVYSEANDEAHRRKFRLLASFREALPAGDQLSLVYQPRIDLGTGECVGAEALLRWTHPVLGQVSPAEFIPLVEQTDLARSLTEWVVNTALHQLSRWRAQGIALSVSINVSASNLEEPDFIERLLASLAERGLRTSDLELEVTEGLAVQRGTHAGRSLNKARAAGMRVAIDDFGTGYSSLSYLQDLPADVIKIDQSFIRGLADDERLRLMIGSMIVMTQSLGFRVVAEGVETSEALVFLKEAGCEEAQGYFFSRPVEPETLERWIAGRLDTAPGSATSAPLH